MTATARGATSVTGEDRKRRKGLLWLALLGLLLLGLLAALLIARRAKNDDTSSGKSGATTTTASSAATTAPVTTAPVTSAPVTSAPVTSAPVTSAPSSTAVGGSSTTGTNGSGVTTVDPNASGAASTGSVVSGSTPLLPLPSAGLASFSGKAAKGTGAPVESVVADEGFWVGTSSTKRVFVHLDLAGESRQQVRAGEHVSFSGKVTKLTQAPAQLGLEPGEGSSLLQKQGAYISANDLQVKS